MVELLISILVAAVLVALAYPELSAIVHKNRIKATVSDLYASMALARSEATKRRNAVRVCPSDTGTSCPNDAGWTDGWIVFDNADNNGTPAAAEIISRVSSVHARINMDIDAAVSDYVEFRATGHAFGTSGSFRICHTDTKAKAYALTISAGGQLSEHERTVVACVDE